MPKFIGDAARSSWEHFTGWWVWPVHAAISLPMLVLVVLGVGGDTALLGLRIMAYLAIWLIIYEMRWRKKGRAKKARRSKA